MKPVGQSKPKKKSLGQFLGWQLVFGGGSFLLAFFAARWADANAPGLLGALAALLPSWSPINPTGFAVAYAFFALVVYLVLNSILFLTGKRKL